MIARAPKCQKEYKDSLEFCPWCKAFNPDKLKEYARRDTHNRTVDFYETPSTYRVYFNKSKVEKRFREEYDPKFNDKTETMPKQETKTRSLIPFIIILGIALVLLPLYMSNMLYFFR